MKDGVFTARINHAIVLGVGDYFIEIAAGQIAFYQQQASVATSKRVRKRGATNVSVQVQAEPNDRRLTPAKEPNEATTNANPTATQGQLRSVPTS